MRTFRDTEQGLQMQPTSPATACLCPAEAPMQAAGTVGARDRLGSLPRPCAGGWFAPPGPRSGHLAASLGAARPPAAEPARGLQPRPWLPLLFRTISPVCQSLTKHKKPSLGGISSLSGCPPLTFAPPPPPPPASSLSPLLPPPPPPLPSPPLPSPPLPSPSSSLLPNPFRD